MDNPILYVVINKSLKMSPGKVAAQAVHAAMSLGAVGWVSSFVDHYRRSVIVLEAEDTDQIKNLHEYLKNANIYSKYYIDEGMNEVSAYSITALAVSPIDSEDTKKREIFETFRLFSGEGDDYTEAYEHLSAVSRGFRDYGTGGNHMPRHMRKTLEWLEQRAK